MGEIFSELGDLVFSLVIGYVGCLELIYVVRHLYHWSFRHACARDANSLHDLQDHMRNKLAAAEAREANTGTNLMEDGVMYKDGFRIEPQELIANIDSAVPSVESRAQRRKEIEAELLKQKQIEEETRQQLKEAENKFAVEELRRAEEEEENTRKLLEEERQREEEHRRKELEQEEAAENARKLLEAERHREEEQRRIEMETERSKLERQRTEEEVEKGKINENYQEEYAENERKREEDQHKVEQEQEKEEQYKRELDAEKRQKETDDEEPMENEQRLIDAEREVEEISEKEHEDDEAIDLEQKLFKLSQIKGDSDAKEFKSDQLNINLKQQLKEKQKSIEENARTFLKVEEGMIELQQKMAEAVMLQQLEDLQQQPEMRQYSTKVESAPNTPVVEEPCIKKFVALLTDDPDEPQTVAQPEPLMQTVKTQFGQTSNKPYSLTTKPLLFPSLSDDASSIEPYSSQQSSLSTQPSEEFNTAADNAKHFEQLERQEPDGEDNIPPIQYTDDYLRSLDGIKHRPLMREDGSGRRRAFKKRRSSADSSSSRDSRVSREEEVKMFTSLEEEELRPDDDNGNDDYYKPIKYTNEPTSLKVKGHHHRRHKRSPAKEVKSSDENSRSSLEMLGEKENSNPWGEVVPEHYKDTDFWKREKAQSIDEEEIEVPSAAGEATNKPKMLSFEEATHTQNEEAMTSLQKQKSKENVDKDNKNTMTKIASAKEEPSENTSNLQTSTSPRLRRSPRIDEIDQYEERWKETVESSPTKNETLSPSIVIHSAIDNDPWRDEYGLIMEGLSDFYDFQASANPSRSASRNTSPVNSPPASPIPRNVSQEIAHASAGTIDVYYDTGNLIDDEFRKDRSTDFIEKNMCTSQLNVIADSDMNETVQKLGADRQSRSRSRSHSSIPTTDNIERSMQSRQNKRIRINDELLEKLKIDQMPEIPNILVGTNNVVEEKPQEVDGDCSRENMSPLVESLRVERSRSHSRSRSRSPLPTPDNVERSLLTRRTKLIQHNNELFEELSKQALIINTQVLPTISVESSESNEQQTAVSFEPNKSRISVSESDDFQLMLNLEASSNKTLTKNSEEYESIFAEKQRLVDQEALEMLKIAEEEVELRTLTPTSGVDCVDEKDDKLGHLPPSERVRQLRCTPTSPDYDRSMSAEWRDVQRIKNEMIANGFKRSTYVGESLDLGSEYKSLRREAARFRRSQSPSPSVCESHVLAREAAAKNRKIQDLILVELTSVSTASAAVGKSLNDGNKHGAKRKIDRKPSTDYSRSISEMRSEMSAFRRSRSKSRSPLDQQECRDIERIETEAAKRELQDQLLDDITKTTISFQDFSRHLNVGFLDSDRRASDSALMQKPEVLMQFDDYVNADADIADIEPEEYHHFRRYSLHQESQVEEYPNDDYDVYVSQVEVRTLNGTRTWIREDFYSDNDIFLNTEGVEETNEIEEQAIDNHPIRDEEEDETEEGSEDERQTVVEVEDEIDEDICDFNEHCPAEESHHEQSECEEAEREMDRYADRVANDWREMQNYSEILYYNNGEEGPSASAAGANVTSPAYSDTDSLTIDQIYGDAIKNRKQSGILRDYDSILQEMQNNSTETESDSYMSNANANDRYALWAKTRELEKMKMCSKNGIESSINLLDSKRRDGDMRYLGDAKVTARQFTRLRSRYGYVPVLESTAAAEIEDVDLNYKPRKEYNWRKNFKLDDNGEQNININQNVEEETDDHLPKANKDKEDVGAYLDLQRYNFGEESITLFSRSPEREGLEQVLEEETQESSVIMYAEQEPYEEAQIGNEINDKFEKPKKKRSKKKLRKNTDNHSFDSITKDEDDSESLITNNQRRRRCNSNGSNMGLEETDSPKRMSRSRRSSKNSLTNDELFSPRSSIVYVDANTISDINEEYAEIVAVEPTKKKLKKRTKRNKESIIEELNNKEKLREPIRAETPKLQFKIDIAKASGTSTPTIKPSTTTTNAKNTTVTTTSSTTTPVDSFDILKDANFYPLF